MISYLKIVFKSFLNFRRKRKSLTLVLGGAYFLIFFLVSLYSTLFTNIENYWGKMLLGDGAIVVKDYKDYKALKPPKNKYLFSYRKIEDKLKSISGIKFSPRLRVFGLLEGYTSRSQIPMVLIGMDAKKEKAIISNDQLESGHLPEEGTKQVAMFFNAAGRLNVDKGDTVIIFTTDINGYTVYDLLTVSGIIEPRKTQDFADGDVVGFIPLSFADSIKSVEQGTVSDVAFSSGSYLKRAMLPVLIPGNFKVVSMWNSEDIPLTMKWIYGFVFWILLILIIGIVFVSIFHSINLMILERRRELGVYLTYGASKWWILKIWIGEFTFYLLYCSIIGGIISTLMVYGINSIELTANSAAMEVMLAASQFSISLSPAYYLLSFFLLWLVVITASLQPALRGINEDVIVKLFRK